jgi:uncharacterized RDD family membrane protein YckC
MAWYYIINGASHGPVAETEIHNLREQNVVALDTPVWTDGMAEWVSFGQSALSGAGSAAVAPVLTHTCAECGKAFPAEEMLQYENAWVCAACKPVFFQRIKEGVAAKGSLKFASIGGRFLAVLIDGLIIGLTMGIFVLVPFLMVATWVVSPGKTLDQEGWFIAIIMIVVYGLPPLYEIVMIGKYGATLGKMAMRIRVIRPDGARVSFARSTGRYFAKVLSGMILYIGYLMAFWDEEKCALHDRICQTRVISVDPS